MISSLKSRRTPFESYPDHVRNTKSADHSDSDSVIRHRYETSDHRSDKRRFRREESHRHRHTEIERQEVGGSDVLRTLTIHSHTHTVYVFRSYHCSLVIYLEVNGILLTLQIRNERVLPPTEREERERDKKSNHRKGCEIQTRS